MLPGIFTARKRSCGKVMFLHLSVSHSVHGGGGLPSPLACRQTWGFGQIPPGYRPPPGRSPWADLPPDEDPPGQTPPGRPPGQTPWADTHSQMQTPLLRPPLCRPPSLDADPPDVDPLMIRQQAGGTHPTGMHTCPPVFFKISLRFFSPPNPISNTLLNFS